MIVITGASRGIGQFLLEHFISQGETVIGIANRTEPGAGHADHYYRMDITREEELTGFIEKFSPQLHELTLINAAGVSYNAVAHRSEMQQWKAVIDVNLTGLYHLTRLLLPFMREDNFGRVINLGSVLSHRGVAGTSAYTASKAALQGMVKALAAENATKNITVNNINLGYFDIGMIEEVPVELLNGIIGQIPAKRLGKPEEILSAVQFIRQNAYFNGASLELNGGLT